MFTVAVAVVATLFTCPVQYGSDTADIQDDKKDREHQIEWYHKYKMCGIVYPLKCERKHSSVLSSSKDSILFPAKRQVNTGKKER